MLWTLALKLIPRRACVRGFRANPPHKANRKYRIEQRMSPFLLSQALFNINSLKFITYESRFQFLQKAKQYSGVSSQ